MTVVLAAEGYPQNPRKGDLISGLGDNGQLASAIEGVTVFHAGTTKNESGAFITAGGRVFAVTGVGLSMKEARSRAYEAASLITFKGKVMRSDIALAVV